MHHAGRRPTATTAAAMSGTALALALAALAFAPLPAAAAGPDAPTLYREAIAATHGWSVHYASSATVSGQTIIESGDAGPASGTQSVAVGKSEQSLTDQASIIVIGDITYLKGNAAALSDMTGMTADEAQAIAGQWVDFATDDATLSSVSAGVRSTDLAHELALTGHLTRRPSRSLQGLRVYAVEGTQTIGGKHVHVVLYVRASGPHVPVEEDAVDASGKPSGELHIVYSKWGEAVRPVAPQVEGSLGPVSST